MIRTVQAVISKDGEVHLVEPITLDGEHRALVLADAGLGDRVCVQITSNPYADWRVIRIDTPDFRAGSLNRISYGDRASCSLRMNGFSGALWRNCRMQSTGRW